MKLTLDISPDTGYGRLHLRHTVLDRTLDDYSLDTNDVEEIKEKMLLFVEGALIELKRDKTYHERERQEMRRQIDAHNARVVGMVQQAMKGGE